MVFCACVGLLVIMFAISNSIGKNAANRAAISPTTAPVAAIEPTAAPDPTAEPAPPLLVYRNQPESTPYVSETLIQTIQEIQSAQRSDQDDDIPAEGRQETIASAPPESYVTITDEPLIDETGRAGQPGDPVGIPLLVNAANRLPPEWYPDDMVYLSEYCPEDIVRIKALEIQGATVAVDALLEMLSDAVDQGQANWQISAGYRSYNYQQSLVDERVRSYMRDNGMSRTEAANAAARYVAAPGASEHHTGLAFDITIPGWTFEATEQCAWLAKHCAEYGFIVRYTKDKVKITGIEAEPWHIRYVGKEHAMAMTEAGLCLEEYVELLLSQRSVR